MQRLLSSCLLAVCHPGLRSRQSSRQGGVVLMYACGYGILRLNQFCILLNTCAKVLPIDVSCGPAHYLADKIIMSAGACQVIFA